MEYFTNMLKKAAKSAVITTVLIVVLWGALYRLTSFEIVMGYFWTGVMICLINTWLDNFRQGRMKNIIHTQGNWVIMAGTVLVLYHADYQSAAVFTAAAIFASPFFGATLYEGIVGLSLLITLATLMA